jgi:hypothetical protein
MSDFTPLEQFRKHFTTFDLQVHKLRQMNPPAEFTRVFSDFSTLKQQYTVFYSTCQRILRHNKLTPPNVKLPEEVYSVVVAFPEQSNAFFGVLSLINNQKPRIYVPRTYELLNQMEQIVSDFAELCERKQQTRLVYKKFGPQLTELLLKIRSSIDSLFLMPFDSLDVDAINSVIEPIKLLSRLFEADLMQSFRSERLLPQPADSSRILFHDVFVAIVLLLSRIPDLNQAIDELLRSVRRYLEILRLVFEETRVKSGDPIYLFMPGASGANPPSASEDSIVLIDPIDNFLSDIAHLFDCSSGRNLPQADWCEEILNTARNRIDELRKENHELQTRIRSVEFIASEQAFNERFTQNKIFQDTLVETYKLKETTFLRSVIDKIKVLCPAEVIYPTDDYHKQVDVIVANAKIEIENLRQRAWSLGDIVDKCHISLKETYRANFGRDLAENDNLVDRFESVVNALGNAHKEMDVKLSEIDPSRNELAEFLTGTLKGRIADSEKLTLSQMQMIVANLITDGELKLADVRFELEKERSGRTELEREIHEFCALVHRRLALATSSPPKQPEKATLPELSGIIRRLLGRVDEIRESDRLFRRFIASFLSQLMFALRMPVLKLQGLSHEQLKDAMTAVIDSPPIHRKLGSFEHREEEEEHEII